MYTGIVDTYVNRSCMLRDPCENSLKARVVLPARLVIPLITDVFHVSDAAAAAAAAASRVSLIRTSHRIMGTPLYRNTVLMRLPFGRIPFRFLRVSVINF